jgi:hypothetical protein
MHFSTVLVLFPLLGSSYTPLSVPKIHQFRLSSSSNDVKSDSTPLSFVERFSATRGASASVATALGVALSISSVPVAVAADGKLAACNLKLSEYGLPPMVYVPSGFSPIVSEFGRGNIKSAIKNPIVVEFCYPDLWVVQKTSVNNNGESGTIGANDYAKGDSANFFTTPVPPASNIADKTFVKKVISAALSRKGDMMVCTLSYNILSKRVSQRCFSP